MRLTFDLLLGFCKCHARGTVDVAVFEGRIRCDMGLVVLRVQEPVRVLQSIDGVDHKLRAERQGLSVTRIFYQR